MLDDARFEAAATDATINYTDDAIVNVNGDPGLLRSAIENVVRNAIFYSGEGGKIDVRLCASTMATPSSPSATTAKAFRKTRFRSALQALLSASTTRAEPPPAAWDWDWPSCAMP